MKPSSAIRILLATTLCWLHLNSATAYNQNPSVFVDVDCISSIDRLRDGFSIHVPETLVSSYSNPQTSLTSYVSAIPLSPKSMHRAVRSVFAPPEPWDGVINVGSLDPDSWYYVCVEFENVKQFERHGNTSTTCKLARTLNSAGEPAFSTISDVTLMQASGNFMEFTFRSDANYPVFYDIYLNKGPAEVIAYFVDSTVGNATTGSRTPTISILIESLHPGVNYGQLCISERPFVTAYTAMGREIQLEPQLTTHCFMEDLKTSLDHEAEWKKAPYSGRKFGRGSRTHRRVGGSL